MAAPTIADRLRAARADHLRALEHLDAISLRLAAGAVGMSLVGASDDATVHVATMAVEATRAAHHAIHLELHAPENHDLTPGDAEDLAAALRSTLRANEGALPDLIADAGATFREQAGY